MTIIIFILILALLVLVHEFGHFITARKSGMKVYEFGFGFPPRALGVYKDPVTKKFVWVWGKGRVNSPNGDHAAGLLSAAGGSKREEEFPTTVYSLNWLPLGGFCKIKGEEGENKNETDSFAAKVAWKRTVVLAAGVTMNVVLAAVLLIFGFMVGLPTDFSGGVDKQAIIVEQAKVTIQQVEKNSPAELGGIKTGDKVLSVDNLAITNSAQMVEYVGQKNDQVIKINLERQGKNLTLDLTPKILKVSDPNPRLGIILADAGIIRYPWYLAIYKGIVATGYGILNIIFGFYFIIKGLIFGQGLTIEVAGPVGIASLVGSSIKMGFNYLINLTAMLSLTLAVINILPIPALDGGRIFFILLEKIFRKPVPMKYEQLAHTIGFMLLMCLIVVVTFRDIKGLF